MSNTTPLDRIKYNTKLLQSKYKDCIENAVASFEEAEKRFMNKLMSEIDKELQDIIENKAIDYTQDIMGHHYAIFDLVNYDAWKEFCDYTKFIKCAPYDYSKKIHEFIYKSLEKYGFPSENIFDCYDNGWFRYKLMSFDAKSVTIGEKYEDYER